MCSTCASGVVNHGPNFKGAHTSKDFFVASVTNYKKLFFWKLYLFQNRALLAILSIVNVLQALAWVKNSLWAHPYLSCVCPGNLATPYDPRSLLEQCKLRSFLEHIVTKDRGSHCNNDLGNHCCLCYSLCCSDVNAHCVVRRTPFGIVMYSKEYIFPVSCFCSS